MAIVGSFIDGKYEILKLIGRGGMSNVYVAMDTNLNKQWAVKEIIRDNSDSMNQIKINSIIAEANLMKKLDHPMIPRIVDILDKGDVIYIVMDYIEGESLESVLKKTGPLPEETVISIGESLCNVLDYLHSLSPMVIYRDLKPANIMLTPNGNIKLIDFGIAYETGNETSTIERRVGTRGYASPEQCEGKQTDETSDIYSLGMTLFELVTGKNPAEENKSIFPIRYYNDKLSPGLEEIIIRCTKKEKANRYQSIGEVLYSLWHYEEADAKFRKKLKKRLVITIVALILFALFLISGIVMRYQFVKLRENDYDSLLLKAKASNSQDELESYCKKAIKLLPGEKDAYIVLIDRMKSDAAFTVEEEKTLHNLVNHNVDELKKDDSYGELCYRIGHLYWYYYDYEKDNSCDDNANAGMKMALPWFERSIEYGNSTDEYMKLSEAYVSIANFNTNINLMILEATDAGEYREYFDSLKELLSIAERDNTELLSLQIYDTVVNALNQYAHKFKNDGVSKEEQIEVLEKALAGAKSIEPMTEKTANIKKDIDTFGVMAKKIIEQAYKD